MVEYVLFPGTITHPAGVVEPETAAKLHELVSDENAGFDFIDAGYGTGPTVVNCY